MNKSHSIQCPYCGEEGERVTSISKKRRARLRRGYILNNPSAIDGESLV